MKSKHPIELYGSRCQGYDAKVPSLGISRWGRTQAQAMRSIRHARAQRLASLEMPVRVERNTHCTVINGHEIVGTEGEIEHLVSSMEKE